ncbi:MAG TPA: GNAT family N-acetyltransferase [Ktedonobacterales bacterium]|nr:GNAT family N-acetyltransferase [Ktedonobacterales bacterium]
MRLTRSETVADFVREAGPFLMRHEDEHNLMLGLCATLARQPEVYPDGAYLATITAGDAVITAALRTPPHQLVLAGVADGADAAAAHALLAADVRALYGALSGASGRAEVVRSFAGAWHALTGEPYHQMLDEYFYRLDRVIPPPPVTGALRRATEADRPLLERWLVAFHAEVFDEPDTDQSRWVTNALTFVTRGVYLWEDGEVVALAGWQGPTEHGVRIGPVYTPPEQRRRGYAGACVGALSQLLLDEGRDFCVLYTDVSNATSNHVYQMLGYQRIMEAGVYAFGA